MEFKWNHYNPKLCIGPKGNPKFPTWTTQELGWRNNLQMLFSRLFSFFSFICSLSQSLWTQTAKQCWLQTNYFRNYKTCQVMKLGSVPIVEVFFLFLILDNFMLFFFFTHQVLVLQSASVTKETTNPGWIYLFLVRDFKRETKVRTCGIINVQKWFSSPLLSLTVVSSSPQWSSCVLLSETSRRNALAQEPETSWIPESGALQESPESLTWTGSRFPWQRRTNRRKHWGNPVILQRWTIINTQSGEGSRSWCE